MLNLGKDKVNLTAFVSVQEIQVLLRFWCKYVQCKLLRQIEAYPAGP